MDGYERRSSLKKQAIMDAAQKLFFEHGVNDVSIAEIARTAQVSQVTIYNYFGSKDKLLREVIHAVINKAMNEAEVLLAMEIPFMEKLKRLFMQGEIKEKAFSKSFFNSVAWDDPQLQALYKEVGFTKVLPFFQRLIEQGKQAGEIDKSITSDAVMAYISAFMSVFTHSDYLRSSKEYKDGFSRLFFCGLIGK